MVEYGGVHVGECGRVWQSMVESMWENMVEYGRVWQSMVEYGRIR